MTQPKLCVLTQTPLLRFFRDAAPAHGWRETEDYQVSPGGVTRMVLALLKRLRASGRIGDATWVSLTRNGPDRLRLEDELTVEHARLAPRDLARYAAAKSALWDSIHGTPTGDEPLTTDEIADGLAPLSAAFAARAAAAGHARGFDAYYVHDFQLLPLAAHLPPGVPKLFRWHVPVPDAHAPHMDYVATCLNAYDAVVVSTRAYAERLRDAGVTVPVHARYPHVEETHRPPVTTAAVARAESAWGLGRDSVFVAVVARLDPMKSQDVAIRALARVARRHPHAKLLLVGGGGFSGGRRGSLGLPHASRWERELNALARDLGVADRVVFTGNITEAELSVVLTRARAVLLPSRLEGFGLAPVEAWLHGRPVVVSHGAGVAELVREDVNGFTFPPGDEAALARHLDQLLGDAALADRLGRAGRVTAAACHVSRAADDVWHVLNGLLARSRATRVRGARRPRVTRARASGAYKCHRRHERA